MSRSANLKSPPAGHGSRSPALQGLAIITEGESLSGHDNIPNISIDESFLTNNNEHLGVKCAADSNHSQDHTPKPIINPPDSICGARIAVYRHTGTGRVQKKRTATIGGVFWIGNRYYALTAAHVFFDNIADSGAWTDSGLHVTSTSGNGVQHDTMRPRISETYEVIIEKYWPNTGDPDLHMKPTNVSIGLVAPSVLHRRKGPEAVVLPKVIWDDELDWALIELTDTALCQINILQLSLTTSISLKPPQLDQTRPTGDVIIAAGVSGLVFGKSLDKTSTIQLPWSDSEIKVWTIEGELALGDCGSMALCPTTGIVYGIVVAHKSGSAITHIVPAPSIFESILGRYSEQSVTLSDMFLVDTPTTSSSTLAEKEVMPQRYSRAPVVRSAETDVTSIFTSNLKAYSMQSVSGRRFIRRTALLQWLLSERRDGIPIIDFILDDAYPRTEMIPITSNQIASGQETSLLMLCILFELGLGYLIHSFMRQGLTDNRLPFDLSLLQEATSRMGLPGSDQTARMVFENQWSYCPMHFDLEMERDIPPQMIVPIHQRQEINAKGGSATLWQITVLEEFVGERLQAVSAKARFDDTMDKLGPRYNFAIKSSSKHHLAHFESELAAFKVFRSIPGMIGYFGNYTHAMPRPKRRAPSFSVTEEKKPDEEPAETNNILLEYGDFDLDEYFAATGPPVLPIQVTQFWQELAGVAEAISEIHRFSTRRAGIRQEYSGWHADIKPDNILYVKGSFKLADPGFARFERSDKKLTRLAGGTKIFGSPEVHSAQRIQDSLVSQAIDIWSLGCVLSVAATWVVLGWSGVAQFQELRVGALNRIAARMPGRNRSRSRSTGRTSASNVNGRRGVSVPEGDCFHDGKNVLDEVHDWHTFLRTVSRKSDAVTASVLDLIDSKMLVSDPKQRIEAVELYNQMRMIVHSGETSEHGIIPDAVTQTLLKVDDTAVFDDPTLSAVTVSSMLTDLAPPSPNIKASSKSLLPPSPQPSLSPRPPTITSSTISEDENHQAVPESQPQRPFKNILLNEVGGRSVSSSIDIPISQTRPPSTRVPGLKPARRMSVTQARAEVDKKKKVFYRRRKDPFLIKHLENRDIEFLIDNGDTMAKYWNEVKELIDILSSMVSDVDKDGFDLSFTTSPVQLKQKSNSKAVKSMMENDRAKPAPGIYTDMSDALNRVLSNHFTRLKAKSSRPYNKNYTLIVLTDGVWNGMREPHAVEDTIISWMNEITRYMGPKWKSRSVTIQFIQFGHDEEATGRLQMLDRGLIDVEIPDIIDTEPSDGNVWKMLLGSVEASFDYADSGV